MAVASAPHRDFQSMSTSEFEGIPDIIGVDTPCNQGGSSLRVGVPKKDTSRCLITGVGWKNEATLQLCAEFLESVCINMAYVTGCDLTEGCRQPQRSSCGERPLDELATALTGVKIHGCEAPIVQTVLRMGRMYAAGWPTLRLNLPRNRLAHLSRFSKGGYHLIQALTRNSARRCSLINTVPASP